MHSGTQPLCSLSMRHLRGWKLSWEESWGKAPTGKDIVVLERSSCRWSSIPLQCGTYHGPFTGETITDFDFNETGEIGVLFREDGWTYRGHIGGLAYDYIAPRKYLEVQYVAGYILPKDATEDHPATLPADLEAIVWYMIAQQWAIIENDAAGLSAFSISDVSWTFDKNISETWQSVISKYQRW